MLGIIVSIIELIVIVILTKHLINLKDTAFLDELKEKVKDEHIHEYARWVFFSNIKNSHLIFQEGHEPNPYFQYSSTITIQRICNECGDIEYKSFDTPIVDNEEKLPEVTKNLLEYLNETILYVEPEKPAPEPAPIHNHVWGKRGIVSEETGSDSGSIEVRRYCICGAEEIKIYRTYKYNSDNYNGSQVMADMKLLKKHIQETLIDNQENTPDSARP